MAEFKLNEVEEKEPMALNNGIKGVLNCKLKPHYTLR